MHLICTIYTLHTAYIYTYIYCLHAWLFSLSMVDNWLSIDNGCLLDLFAAIGLYQTNALGYQTAGRAELCASSSLSFPGTVRLFYSKVVRPKIMSLIFTNSSIIKMLSCQSNPGVNRLAVSRSCPFMTK